MFAIEAEGVGIPTKARDITGASAFILSARGNLVYNILPDGKFVPFVLVGAGFYNVASTDGDGSYTAIKTDTDFEFHGGAGAKIFFTDIVHARLDARAIGVPSKEATSYTLDWEFIA